MNSLIRTFAAAFVGAVLWLAFGHAQSPGSKAAERDNLSDVARTTDGPDAGSIFKLHCAHCHGSKGEGGRGPALRGGRLPRAGTVEAIRQVISEGIPGTEMPRFFFDESQLGAITNWVHQLAATPGPPLPGDAERGRQLFFSRGNCTACHSIRGEGGVAGPDLGDVGLRRGPDYLFRSLVEPEADVPENFIRYRWHTVIPDNYLLVRVVPRGRDEITGIRLNEDPFTIQIREATGRIHSFVKSELAALHKDWGKSIMVSYRDVFSNDELHDLVAFLNSLRGAK